jgi:hypothetical protein
MIATSISDSRVSDLFLYCVTKIGLLFSVFFGYVRFHPVTSGYDRLRPFVERLNSKSNR